MIYGGKNPHLAQWLRVHRWEQGSQTPEQNVKLIAFSREDIAGNNIVKILVENYGFEKRKDIRVIGFEESFLFKDRFDEFEPEICIVASRHRSDSGKPTLTCHSTGNFGRADVGGKEGQLAIAPALYLRQALLGLKRNVNDLPYEISLEVTHHGPSELPFPVLFIEVGSEEKQWRDMKACEVVAKTINELVEKEPEKAPVAIGFGGPHYAPNFSKISENVALGHIAPKYAADFLNEGMIRQMMERTTPTPELAVIDWKGFRGAERSRIIESLDKLNIAWKKTSELHG